jgi:glycerate 2-kinase
MAGDDSPRRFVVAPDSFKGTFDSLEVAGAIGRGVESAGVAADACPLADGGEGTAAVLLADRGGEWVEAPAHDPLGRPIDARFASLTDGTAAVDTAEASGLSLVDSSERDPERASSFGTGELVSAAAQKARRVLLAAGGSATVDGGAGAIDAIRNAGGLGDAQLVVLCDVRTPFERAAAVFGPQKGADAEAVGRLERRLADLAESLPRDPRGVPMTGCAGGLSGGLWAAFGAHLVPGAAVVLGLLGFDRRLEDAEAVITGEGQLDPQSVQGKLVGEVARRCRAAGIPAYAIVGELALEPAELRRLGLSSAEEARTPEAIRAAAERIAALTGAGG